MTNAFRHCNLFLAAMLILAGSTGCAGTARSTQSSGVDNTAGDSLDWLAWMTGTWVMEHEGTIVEEQWTAPRGGTLFGTSRTISDGRMVFFEYLRIEDRGDGAVVYLASPAGRFPPTSFRVSARWPMKVIFTNPEHDFPQTVQYERAGDTLTATVSGEQGGETMSESWIYRRAE